MYSRQFTLCYCLVKSLLLHIRFFIRFVLETFVYVIAQLRHSFVVQLLLREILDPPLVVIDPRSAPW